MPGHTHTRKCTQNAADHADHVLAMLQSADRQKILDKDLGGTGLVPGVQSKTHDGTAKLYQV